MGESILAFTEWTSNTSRWCSSTLQFTSDRLSQWDVSWSLNWDV